MDIWIMRLPLGWRLALTPRSVQLYDTPDGRNPPRWAWYYGIG